MSRSPSLDPLARREFLQSLMEVVAEHGVSVVLSSHLISDLDRVWITSSCSSHPGCRWPGRSAHCWPRITAFRAPPDLSTLPANQEVIEARHTDSKHALVRTDDPISTRLDRQASQRGDLVLALHAPGGDAGRTRRTARESCHDPFTWLQFRAQAVVASGRGWRIVAAAPRGHRPAPGPPVWHSGIGDLPGPTATCGPLAGSFLSKVATAKFDHYPVLPRHRGASPFPHLGMFWGAPLVTRELELAPFRLAWTQGVSRTRWMAVKLGVIGWPPGHRRAAQPHADLVSSPIDTAPPEAGQHQLHPLGLVQFATRGITPIGYAAFAFALGVTAGC